MEDCVGDGLIPRGILNVLKDSSLRGRMPQHNSGGEGRQVAGPT